MWLTHVVSGITDWRHTANNVEKCSWIKRRVMRWVSLPVVHYFSASSNTLSIIMYSDRQMLSTMGILFEIKHRVQTNGTETANVDWEITPSSIDKGPVLKQYHDCSILPATLIWWLFPNSQSSNDISLWSFLWSRPKNYTITNRKRAGFETIVSWFYFFTVIRFTSDFFLSL